MMEANILVVDDEPEVCEIVADGLARETDWVVDYTTEPLRALEQLGEGHYDVMLTDLRMPEMDGLELARQARGMCPGLPVVALTGYASLDSSVSAMRLGFTDYLEKPVRLDAVQEAVYRALERRRAEAGAEEAADEVTYDNARLARTNGELRDRLEVVSRELAMMEQRLAGDVSRLMSRCEAADRLDGEGDVHRLMAMSLLQLQECLPGDEHVIALVAQGPPRVLATACLEREDVVVHWAECPLARGVVRAVMKRGQPALIEDLSGSAVLGDLAAWIADSGSLVALPIAAAGRVRAVGLVRRNETGMTFGSGEVRRATGSCDAMGRALDTALGFRELQSLAYRTLTGLVDAAEERSEWTRGHSRRVARLARAVGRDLGLSGDLLERLNVAGRLHDVGKVSLAASAESSDPRHGRRGAEILEPLGFLGDVGRLVAAHHDMDGPGDDVAVEHQVLAAAEAFDELTHDGPARPGVSAEEALATLQRTWGNRLSGEILSALAGVALAAEA